MPLLAWELLGPHSRWPKHTGHRRFLLVEGSCRPRGRPPVPLLLLLAPFLGAVPTIKATSEEAEGLATRCECPSLRWCTNPMQEFHRFDAATYGPQGLVEFASLALAWERVPLPNLKALEQWGNFLSTLFR